MYNLGRVGLDLDMTSETTLSAEGFGDRSQCLLEGGTALPWTIRAGVGGLVYQ